MFRHLVWNQWSHESQHIPFWLILTGCEHSMHGYFHLGSGFWLTSPLIRRRRQEKINCDGRQSNRRKFWSENQAIKVHSELSFPQLSFLALKFERRFVSTKSPKDEKFKSNRTKFAEIKKCSPAILEHHWPLLSDEFLSLRGRFYVIKEIEQLFLVHCWVL